MKLGEEYRLPLEEEAISKISQISQIPVRQSHPALRSQHPKQHGCVWAKFIVAENLPDYLKVGLFKEPKTFPAWIRFSNLRQRDDTEGDAQGMAMKLMEVEGEKVLEEEKEARTHDFLFTDHPVFLIKNVPDYAEFFDRRAKSGSKPPFKFLFPSFNPWQWRWREAFILIVSLGIGKKIKKNTSPLETQYWSMTPYRLGLQLIKPSWTKSTEEPCLPAIKFFAKPSPSNVSGKSAGRSPNYMREVMAEFLKNREAIFDFYIQLQSDPVKNPIEDPTIEWKDTRDYKVATIVIPPQIFDSSAQMEFGENLSFTPWHCLKEHIPLGGINRTRKLVYQQNAKLRRELNSVVPQEPTPETFKPSLL
jgi:hypothetical protein